MQVQTGITQSYYFNGIGTISQMSAQIVRTYQTSVLSIFTLKNQVENENLGEKPKRGT